jgi:hypothetical protein
VAFFLFEVPEKYLNGSSLPPFPQLGQQMDFVLVDDAR